MVSVKKGVGSIKKYAQIDGVLVSRAGALETRVGSASGQVTDYHCEYLLMQHTLTSGILDLAVRFRAASTSNYADIGKIKRNH